jgi:hypothetical protein
MPRKRQLAVKMSPVAALRLQATQLGVGVHTPTPWAMALPGATAPPATKPAPALRNARRDDDALGTASSLQPRFASGRIAAALLAHDVRPPGSVARVPAFKPSLVIVILRAILLPLEGGW